jgi:hypothetical protein
MLRGPARWRGAMEIDRHNEAVGLRDRVNEHYLSDDVHNLVDQAPQSACAQIEHEQQQAS